MSQNFITRENAPLARLIMYLSQSLCVLYNHNLNKCCTAKNNDTSAFYTHFRSNFQDSIPEETIKAMLLETEINNTICTADQKESRLLRYLVG